MRYRGALATSVLRELASQLLNIAFEWGDRSDITRIDRNR
jgi:hypothetical protein